MSSIILLAAAGLVTKLKFFQYTSREKKRKDKNVMVILYRRLKDDRLNWSESNPYQNFNKLTILLKFWYDWLIMLP